MNHSCENTSLQNVSVENLQFDDYREYCEQPVRKKDSTTHSMYNTPVSHNTESDDSDSEEMLPTGAFWPIPESEEWTVVKRSHGNLGGTIGSGRDRFQNPGKS